MKVIEATGKKLDDAIKEGLTQLGVTIDDVDVEILCSGGIFRKAKVRMTFDEELYEKNKLEEKPHHEDKKEKPANNGVKPEKKFEKARKENKREEHFARKEKQTRPAEQTTAPVEEQVVAAPVKPVSEEQTEMAVKYLTELLAHMNIEASFVVNTDKGSIDVDIVTEDTTVIGHHGEVLDAIQQLCKRAVEEGEDKHLQVNIDCKGYRASREKTLISMANRMAAKAIKTGRKVTLEPMSNAQRKVIHATLNDNDKVFTKSEGKDPARRVVIIPKRSRYGKGKYHSSAKKNSAAPATAESDNQ